MKPIKWIPVMAVAMLTCYCGYQLAGTAATIPEDIRTVSIPDFTNRTVRFNAEQFISDSIRETFIQRSRLTLVTDPVTADSVVQGEIVFFQVTPVTYSGGGEGNLHELEIRINLKFVDNLHRKVLYEKQSITFTDTYRIDSGDVSGFENAALQRIARKFAAEIVTSVLTGIR